MKYSFDARFELARRPSATFQRSASNRSMPVRWSAIILPSSFSCSSPSRPYRSLRRPQPLILLDRQHDDKRATRARRPRPPRHGQGGWAVASRASRLSRSGPACSPVRAKPVTVKMIQSATGALRHLREMEVHVLTGIAPPTLATDTKEAIERPHRGVSWGCPGLC